MDEGNAIRLSPLRPANTSLKSSSSGKSTPRGSSPSFRRLNSGRTPRLNPARSNWLSSQIFRSNRIVLWLLLITLWAYAGFYFQSKWAHGDNKEDLFSGGYGGESSGDKARQLSNRRDLIDDTKGGVKLKGDSITNQSSLSNGVVKKSPSYVRKSPSLPKKRSKRSSRKRDKGKSSNVITTEVASNDTVQEEEELPKTNGTYGLIVGPFGQLEDSILEWSPQKRSGTCDRKGAFARLVWSRKFVLIFHELSMTGAPLAMLELASEFLSCGATINVIVLNKKGGLMSELKRRKIKVLEDKTDLSFKTAMKADLIIAGSAVCSSWIEQYLSRTVLGSSQIMWWIMENRREYFDRSKPVLNRVKKLIFISQSQSNQWLQWCEEEGVELKSKPSLVPLSVNDELAFVAGIPCSLNTPSFTTEIMSEKRRLLREAVRKEMGLNEEDMLVLTLSSINPGKGQFLLLESARLMMMIPENTNNSSVFKDYSNALSRRKVLSSREEKVRVLIGSVGSKSNKVAYVKTLLRFLSAHSNLSGSVLWTPATTRVASLYSAADVYVMNSQGIGETFGRVTIEAMAFGLPILGTDSGGTREIVEQNVTGLLHPLGRPGARVLAENLKFMLENPSARREMGSRGREKVEKLYLKKHMYQKFGEVLYKNMRIK